MTKPTCTISGCERTLSARGWCTMHYNRWYRHGPDFLAHDQTFPTSETWRPVVGYERTYLVSESGKVWSIARPTTPGHLLRQVPTRWGHRQVGLSQDGRAHTHRVHVLVAAAFIGPRPAGLEIRHLDGTGANNHLSNLRYGTTAENAADSVRHGSHLLHKTHCPQGHLYAVTAKRSPSDQGQRCRDCRADEQRARAQRRRAS